MAEKSQRTPDGAAPFPVPARSDLRAMLRRYIIDRALADMDRAARRRRDALAADDVRGYQQAIRRAVAGFYGELPAGRDVTPPRPIPVSTFEGNGYRIENVLFDSFPGYPVNASVYVPVAAKGPWPAVVIPVGHSGKQFASYQLPAQFFARSGYVAITFDPPGQAGEKQPGNDHFTDGVRCYPVGQTSSAFFVADALRCVDYLATRDDVDLSRGAAMTGVSGGGTTTTIAGLLDDRLTVLGPSCCVTPLADLDIQQCYAGCPETHMWGRYAQGVDEVDLLCAALDKAVLLMAGEADSVFRIDDTRRLAQQVQAFFQAAGAADRYEFYVDDDPRGHCYSLNQARQFVRFMNEHLCGRPDRALCPLPDEAFVLDDYDKLRCRPRTDVNMRTWAGDRARTLAAERRAASADPVAGARQIISAPKTANPPAAERTGPFRVWTHYWESILLMPESGIELPGVHLYPVSGASPTLLHFDDRGHQRLLERGGVLAQAVNHLNDSAVCFGALTVDLRGWGDTSPALTPYEIASWGSRDRYLAYATAALGDSLMAMRIRDGLAAFAYLCQRPRTAGVVVSGCGLGAMVALHVAALDARCAGAVVWDGLFSIEALLNEPDYAWPAEAFVPDVLLHYDLPALAAALKTPLRILNPRDGRGQSLPPLQLRGHNRQLNREIYIPHSDTSTIVAELHQTLTRVKPV